MPGTLSPQPTSSDGRLLDDRVGYGWGLLLQTGAETLLGPCARAWIETNQASVVADPAASAWLDEIGAAAAVTRPDRYVLGTATAAADLAALLVAAPAPRNRSAAAAA